LRRLVQERILKRALSSHEKNEKVTLGSAPMINFPTCNNNNGRKKEKEKERKKIDKKKVSTT
jgi:hypothetical protein